VVLAEGLIGAIGEQGLLRAMESAGVVGRYGKVVVDPHGHLRLGEIEFARMILDRLGQKLSEVRNPKSQVKTSDAQKQSEVKTSDIGHRTSDVLDITLIDKDLGYELRCADPNPFDAEYTRDLGYAAVKFLRQLPPDSRQLSDDRHPTTSSSSGAIISFVEGRMKPLPFLEMLNPATKRMKTRKVDVDGEGYECARRYMFRLEKSDFADQRQLQKLAAVAGMTAEDFRQRFAYLAS
jgi:ATP-dependent phosphofructokinase / diphosphate-dependent phosphofructokinase